ncbi:MAG: tetratricopeptide repeat protein [Thermodesulfobacteriota bacterium]|nr:tetratricopeptide repeat protein [Thermodesulfobacteriota bacterium]
MLIFFLAGCARVIVVPTADRPKPSRSQEPAPSPSEPSTPTRPPVETPTQQPTPRALAASELTEQGRILIEEKRPDDAIRTLERAMNLYPKNGKVYYYLSEAWLLKENIAQAMEFNRLARIYLQKDPEWTSRVEHQRLKIQNW